MMRNCLLIRLIEPFTKQKNRVKTKYSHLVELLIFLFLGLSFGSFANVLIYRIPKEISIIIPSSFCPNCKNKIKFYDNIPVLSYLFLKGRCRYCGEKISLRYPLVEILSAIIFVVPYLYFGISLKTLEAISIMYFLMIMAFIDFDTHYVYDILLFPSLYFGFLIAFFSKHLLSSIIFSFLGFLFGILIRWGGNKIFKKEALGEGDPYVFALMGIYIRGFDFLFVFFLSFLIGSIFGIIILLFKKEKYLPLLPFLFSGVFIYNIIPFRWSFFIY